jgi:hypothetical protein
MIKFILKIFLIFIVVAFIWFYLVPYVRFAFSPFSWADADIDKNGFVSPGEADYFADYGMRQYTENGKNCIEYFALKDGLPLKKVCK